MIWPLDLCRGNIQEPSVLEIFKLPLKRQSHSQPIRISRGELPFDALWPQGAVALCGAKDGAQAAENAGAMGLKLWS